MAIPRLIRLAPHSMPIDAINDLFGYRLTGFIGISTVKKLFAAAILLFMGLLIKAIFKKQGH